MADQSFLYVCMAWAIDRDDGQSGQQSTKRRRPDLIERIWRTRSRKKWWVVKRGKRTCQRVERGSPTSVLDLKPRRMAGTPHFRFKHSVRRGGTEFAPMRTVGPSREGEIAWKKRGLG